MCSRLSAFADGFFLDDAEILDLLTRLVDQSLVVVEEAPAGPAHYRLLETLRHTVVGLRHD